MFKSDLGHILTEKQMIICFWKTFGSPSRKGDEKEKEKNKKSATN